MRLYFHLTNGRDRISDEEGVEVADVEVTRRQTLEALAELHQDPGIDPREWEGWQLEVTTASGALVFRICLGLQ
jgi:hypothetical protein